METPSKTNNKDDQSNTPTQKRMPLLTWLHGGELFLNSLHVCFSIRRGRDLFLSGKTRYQFSLLRLKPFFKALLPNWCLTAQRSRPYQTDHHLMTYRPDLLVTVHVVPVHRQPPFASIYVPTVDNLTETQKENEGRGHSTPRPSGRPAKAREMTQSRSRAPQRVATSLKAYVSLDNLAVFRIDGFLREAENKIMSAH